MNAIKILIFKQNNVLYIVTQKVHYNEWNVYNVCKPQKVFSQKKSPSQSREKCLCVF